MNAPVERLPNQALAVFREQSARADDLIGRAITEKVPLENLERLMVMRDKLQAEAAKGAFLDAMSRFQAACPVIQKKKTANVKGRNGGEFSYKYADLGSIARIVGPLIAAEGLSYRIECEFEGKIVKATCIVSHILGHSERSEFRAALDESTSINDTQKTASAQTYAKRYAFCNAFGILTGDADDDGRGAGRQKADDAQDNRKQDPRGTAKPAYPDDRFAKSMPEWKKLMDEGKKTADDIIATVSTKHTLSEAQLQKIRAAAPAGAPQRK